MFEFRKNKLQELNGFIYNSCLHDAKLVSMVYNTKDTLSLSIYNTFFGISNTIIFENVKLYFRTNGDILGDNKTILAFSVEEDFTHLQEIIESDIEIDKNDLYFVVQMFSNNELHIVCNKVIFN